MVKMTFTLDETTVAQLRQAAARLQQPQSAIVREAVQDYAQRIGRLSELERLRLLRVFDEVVPKIPRRAARSTDAELAAVRQARRQGGRLHPAGQ
jgi:hypothetical protein